MLTIHDAGVQLCDGLTRREVLRAGGLGLFGLSLPELLRVRSEAATATRERPTGGSGGKAKSCILLFLLGGPPQHETWDPKPDAPAQIRGEFKPIASAVPGLMVGELMPRTARLTDKVCVLRAVSTNDNAHSSSGYWMLTGYPHQPLNTENAKVGAPNDWPCLGAVVQRLQRTRGALPAAITLPMRIFNTGNIPWPGQDAGFLGRHADPWLFNCAPADADFEVPGFNFAADVPPLRLDGRRSLLQQIDRRFAAVEQCGVMKSFNSQTQQAFDLLRSSRSRNAFHLDQEPPAVRDRYGRNQYGQSVLMARRLVEAGVALVQVNWFRSKDEPSENPCWDTHAKNGERLKTALMPPMDQAYSALLEDLSQRGLLDETLVVWMGEFGRTPKINARAGRDHWGHVYSVALAGGGVRGGQVYGASDGIGGHPRDGRVPPQDLSATIFHCLGYRPDTEIHDNLGRPLPISRGEVIRRVF
jgi:hypothetical protein